MFSPIALPAATLGLMLAIAYFLLRPPEIPEFQADRTAIVAGDTARLKWTLERSAGVTIEPSVGDKPGAPEGSADVSPTARTEYTLTARNWLGISSSAKATIDVLAITAFKATPERLAKEGDEVTLRWETTGATKVKIEPEDGIKDPKPSGEAVVHPAGPTTYTLTATGPNDVTATRNVSVEIGAPTIKRFDVAPGPNAARVYQGDPVQLTWTAEGFSKVVITSDKGNVARDKAELDVTAGPPVMVYPAVAGNVTYTLTASNAAGSAQAMHTVSVSPVSIVQFEAEPTSLAPGQPAKLRWRIERPNDATKVELDPLGPVEGMGERSVSPTADTTYTLRMTAPDGTVQERQVQVAVQQLPVINVFTAPRPSIGFGEEARLTWSVSNAARIEIRTADGLPLLSTDKPEGTLVDVPPAATTYIIEAYSASGKSVKKDFNVDVRPPGQPAPSETAAPSSATGAAPGASSTPQPSPSPAAGASGQSSSTPAAGGQPSGTPAATAPPSGTPAVTARPSPLPAATAQPSPRSTP
jgi:hypothetical protein